MLGIWRSIRKPSTTCLRAIPTVRGTATYEYRKTGDPDGPNYELVHFLRQELHKELVFHGAVGPLVDAIKIVHELDFPVRRASILKRITALDQKMLHKVSVFLGNLPQEELRYLENEVSRVDFLHKRAIKELQTVEGIGPIKAHALANKGCLSVKQLKLPQFWELLSPAIKANLELLAGSGTRKEVEEFMSLFRELLPPGFELYITGSYRRGQPKMHTTELLLFHSSYTTTPSSPFIDWSKGKRTPVFLGQDTIQPPPNLFQEAIAPLQERGLVKSSKAGNSKWMGAFKVDVDGTPEYRKLNIRLLPQPSKAAALLVTTGDWQFVGTCFQKAGSNDLLLKDYGLFRKKSEGFSQDSAAEYTTGSEQDNERRVGSIKWEFVETPDEAALMHEIGMEYVDPTRRNFANLLPINPSPRKRRDQPVRPPKRLAARDRFRRPESPYSSLNLPSAPFDAFTRTQGNGSRAHTHGESMQNSRNQGGSTQAMARQSPPHRRQELQHSPPPLLKESRWKSKPNRDLKSSKISKTSTQSLSKSRRPPADAHTISQNIKNK